MAGLTFQRCLGLDFCQDISVIVVFGVMVLELGSGESILDGSIEIVLSTVSDQVGGSQGLREEV